MAQRFGKYLLHERIAAGGMAEVFRATLPGASGIDKRCVLKRILPGSADDPEFVSMFLDEARLSLSLQHGNIVPVFDFGEVGGSYYLAMEHVAGKDLRAILGRLRRDGAEFPIAVATLVAIEVLRGLAYAHAKTGADGKPLEIVHRDVSPSNILVSYEGEVRLVDFGIAKARAKTTRTDATTLKGKIPYMSPEQAKGEPVDARTDIFATGVILYEMLAGRRPFGGRDEIHTLELVRSAEVVPIREVRPEVPEELAEAVGVALAKDADARFQEARAMQVVLSRFLTRHDSTVTTRAIGALLAERFPDETERAETGRLSEPPTSTDPFERALLDAAGGRAATRRAGPVPTGEETAAGRATSTGARARRRRAIAGIVLGAAVAATIGVIAATRPDTEPATAAPAIPSTSAPLPEFGSLRIDSDPSGATVTLDGRALPDRTPALADSIPAGEVRVEIALAGYEPWAQTIRVGPGGTPRLRVTLVASPAPATAAPPTTRPTEVLRIGSTPWAEVFVDGRRRAESTPASVRLPVGTHTVRLVNPDLGLEKTVRVEVRAGEDNRLVERLR